MNIIHIILKFYGIHVFILYTRGNSYNFSSDIFSASCWYLLHCQSIFCKPYLEISALQPSVFLSHPFWMTLCCLFLYYLLGNNCVVILVRGTYGVNIFWIFLVIWDTSSQWKADRYWTSPKCIVGNVLNFLKL